MKIVRAEAVSFEEMKKKMRRWYCSTWEAMTLKVIACIVVLFVGYYFYAVEWKDLYTIEYVELETRSVKAGETIPIIYRMALHKKCERRVIIQYLVDVETNFATDIQIHFGDLGEGPTKMANIEKNLLIPKNTPPGKYYYEFTVNAICFPFSHQDSFIYRDGLIEVF